jgi:tungstate transport system substrate-binding protein
VLIRREEAMRILLALIVVFASVVGTQSQQRPLVIAATTSIMDSGLFDYLAPKFTARTGIPVRIISRASAQTLISAERGLVDVVIVNDPAALDRFVDRSEGMGRRKLMFNQFVIVGPAADPAKIKGMTDAPAALRRIALLRAPFLTRGDQSGTHVAEQRLWDSAGVNPKARSGNWYRESGLGMGVTLTLAARLDAYVLADHATWFHATDRQNLDVMVQDDPKLFNQYETLVVNPDKHPHVDVPGATAFVDWLVSDEGQNLIAAYRHDGHQLFYPNAKGVN